MRIAFLTSYPLDVRIGSGVVRMIKGYHEAMLRLGYDSTIIHPDFFDNDPVQLACKRLAFNRGLNPRHFNRYDFVIGSDFDGYALDLSGRSTFIALNAGALADILQFESGKEKAVIRHLAEREAQNVRRAKRVIVPSAYSADSVAKYYKIKRDKIAVIPLGIDSKKWIEIIDHGPDQEKRNKNILCVARQYKRKGISDLIRAFQPLAAGDPGLLLTIIGGGPEYQSNMQLAEALELAGQVRFCGDIADLPRLIAQYKNADLFCLPSYHETFGIVFLEAMAARLPIVGCHATAVPEVVSEREGILCQPGNIDQLTESIDRLLNDEKCRASMGHAGRQRALKMNWDRAASQLDKLLGRLSGGE